MDTNITTIPTTNPNIINPSAPGFNIQRLKLDHLFADATARGDAAAIQWLREKAMTEIEVTTKAGVTKKKFLSVNSYRVEYLEKFCGYVKKEAKKKTTKSKREKMLADMIAKAQAAAGATAE